MPHRARTHFLLLALPICTALLPACARATPGAAAWELVWSDEFTGFGIDAAKWTHEVNGQGGGNNELQYYTARPVNSRIENGNLVIEARKETYTGPDGTRGYTSARLNTKFKGDWLLGRFEVRAKMPGRQGLWPAIWMLPTDNAYGTWAASGEIDIAEHRGDLPTTLFTTIHHGGAYPANIHTGRETIVPDLSAAFHDFAMEWDPDQIRWYFDGAEVYRLSAWSTTAAPFPAPFDRRFHLLLNVAVGGNFLPNPPDDADYFPRRMEVDFVRVYRRNPLAQEPFLGSPNAVPGRIEAEHFDTGGDGAAYFDTTAENLGEAFRTSESVDLGASNDIDGGPSIGWFGDREWVEYTVAVARAGRHRVTVRHASEEASAPLRLSLMTGDVPGASTERQLPGTGGWVNWLTSELGELDLPAGESVLRLTAPSSAINVNYFVIESLEPARPGNLWVVE